MTRPLALVTGGVKRVGAAIAGQLADAGYVLALHGNSAADPEEALARKLRDDNIEWHGFRQDFLAEGAAESLIEAVAGHFGRPPELIVNSASIFGQDDIAGIGEQQLHDHFRINSMTPVLLTAALYRRLDETADRACVIHILDQRIRNPNRDQLSYTLSKQALAESVRSLAISCSDRLRVNGVAPGLTLTAGEYGDQQLKNIASMMPLDRLPDPDDIAQATLFLARAKAVTGQIVYVDGGASLTSFDRDFVHLGNDQA